MIVSVGHRAAGIPPGMAFGIGVFDGLHLGHQAIIARLRKEAAARHAPSAILTFDPHPLSVVGTPPLPLFTDDERNELLVEAGIDHLVSQPFDRFFARLSPDRFTGEVLGGASARRWWSSATTSATAEGAPVTRPASPRPAVDSASAPWW